MFSKIILFSGIVLIQWPLIYLPMIWSSNNSLVTPTQYEYTIVIVNPLVKGQLPVTLEKYGNGGWQLVDREDRADGKAELIFMRVESDN